MQRIKIGSLEGDGGWKGPQDVLCPTSCSKQSGINSPTPGKAGRNTAEDSVLPVKRQIRCLHPSARDGRWQIFYRGFLHDCLMEKTTQWFLESTELCFVIVVVIALLNSLVLPSHFKALAFQICGEHFSVFAIQILSVTVRGK